MDSEDSRPGSSSSNSSSSSSHDSENSRTYINSDDKHKSLITNNAASPASSSSSRRSQRSESENAGSQHSGSKSDSDSSSSLSDNDDDEDAKSINGQDLKENRSERDELISPSQTSRRTSLKSINARDEPGKNIAEVNLSHEDLSDVSDLESEKRTSLYNNSKQSVDDESTNGVDDSSPKHDRNRMLCDNSDNNTNSPITDLRQKLEKKKNKLNELENNAVETEGKALNGKGLIGESLEDLVKTHDDEALDFEAEEGECNDTSKDDENPKGLKENDKSNEELNSPKQNDENDEELEEGEVSDEDEKRPEETEPKPVCRFYTRGQCTWGMSCRFLHPGVTDKGNYTMFDLVRPVPLLQGGGVAGSRPANYTMHAADYHDYRTERPALHHRNSVPHVSNVYVSSHETRPVATATDGPVVVESAWERGLRTAKEMMRKANKRKEQDMDFEDKKMHLTLSPDELEKDPYYAKDRLSPTEAVRHPLYPDAAGEVFSASDRYGRAAPVAHYDEIDPYGRSARYRELPPHRMPQYEDERRIRPAREVIVQRVEPMGRGDEWNDPWMRSKSPGTRAISRDRGVKRRRERRSYSSNSSYSSSSSTQSESSSDSSRTLSSRGHQKRRYASNSHKSPLPTSHRVGGRSLRSPSLPSRRSRRSPSLLRHSPTSKRRANASTSPAHNRGSVYSPVHKKKRISPNTKKSHSGRGKSRRHRSSSSSDTVSSDSSASDSESDTGSSSSGTTSRSREHSPKRSRALEKPNVNDRKPTKKADPPKKRSPITIELKKPTAVGVSALVSPTHSATSERDSKKSRREELLKQLRAVEDAIAKKRSKLS